MGTPLMIKPTLEECRLQAAKVGLPDIEAEKFWNYFESNGWRVGRNPMKSFSHALAGWKLRWQERMDRSKGMYRDGGLVVATPQSNIGRYIHQKELERVMEAIKRIRNGYSENMTYSQKDWEELQRLRKRRDELKKWLGCEA